MSQDAVGCCYPKPTGAVVVPTPEIPYTDFLKKVEQGTVVSTVISGGRIRGQYKDGASFATFSPETNNSGMIATLIRSNVKITGETPVDSAWPTAALCWGFASLLLIGVGICFIPRKPSGGGLDATDVRKSRARMLDRDSLAITFDDVAGIEEAKQEVAEIVNILQNPGKYLQLGAKIPRGVLMSGEPGTGKTLLAKAIAGEAGVPFFSISGAEFVEMYVGVGASRVRDLFDQAEKQAPCIIFIDEIDAVGRHRSASTGGGQDERDQTLNQLLVRMDGVDGRKGVIVIAATNRPDILDPALLRPGRFDRQVFVPLPDIRGREQILRTHMRAVPLAHDVCTETIARGAPGLSGADLANLVNEAALFAARANKTCVEQRHFEDAKDKISIGAERRSILMSAQDKQLTAYHEAGHVLVSLSVPDHDRVYKVSVIPRGVAMGVTVHLPRGDRCSYTREYLNSRICSLLGGRVAEELIFGVDKVTTGASSDIQCATEIAHNMVTRYGMSDELGPLTYCNVGECSLNGNTAAIANVSPETARLIDLAVRGIIERNYTRARHILECHLGKLHLMADALIHYETLNSQQISIIADGDIAEAPPSAKECRLIGPPVLSNRALS